MRLMTLTVAATVILAAFDLQPVEAQRPVARQASRQVQPARFHARGSRMRPIAQGQAPRPKNGVAGNAQPKQNGRVIHLSQSRGRYPNLHAPMYPVPRPDIPHQMGGAMITNQALAPHEMLYPHTYRAMYPPYYYKVHGGWVVTPWGVWSHDTWELQGTEVEVKYRGDWGFLSGFVPPAVR